MDFGGISLPSIPSNPFTPGGINLQNAAIGGMFGGAGGAVTTGTMPGLNLGLPQQPGQSPLQTPAGSPTYQTITNPDGTLKSPYQVTPGKLGDTSAWQALAQQQNTANTNQNVSSAQTKAQTGAQSAWSQLAQNGGLSSGARERIATMGDRNAMMTAQDARAQGANNALNISQQGEMMNRQGDQFNLTNDMNAQNINAGRAAGDVQGQNQFNLQNWLGQYTAGAMQNAYNNQPQSIWSRLTGGIL